jgi:hypothetical protein
MIERVIKACALAILLLAGWHILALPSTAQAAEPELRVTTHQMGRFTVALTSELDPSCIIAAGEDCLRPVSQEIIGGVFTPPDEPPVALRGNGIYLLVDTVNKELLVYDFYNGVATPLFGRAVVTVDPHNLPGDRVYGTLRFIDRNPTWTPTRSAYRKHPELAAKLRATGKSYFPPRHPDNAMGEAKLLIDWQVPASLRKYWVARHFHGSAGYAPGTFWDDTTLGCVRLLNEDLLELLSLLGPKVDPKTVKFVLYR